MFRKQYPPCRVHDGIAQPRLGTLFRELHTHSLLLHPEHRLVFSKLSFSYVIAWHPLVGNQTLENVFSAFFSYWTPVTGHFCLLSSLHTHNKTPHHEKNKDPEQPSGKPPKSVLKGAYWEMSPEFRYRSNVRASDPSDKETNPNCPK